MNSSTVRTPLDFSRLWAGRSDGRCRYSHTEIARSTGSRTTVATKWLGNSVVIG